MSPGYAKRTRAGRAEQSADSARVQRRLERERPRPDGRFARAERARLAETWTATGATRAWRIRAVALAASGVVLLVLAFVVAAS